MSCIIHQLVSSGASVVTRNSISRRAALLERRLFSTHKETCA
ncbi:unnamed protein product [Amoebophrya sp. A120]|nr:unnamed protein product [Amoebophrya sp. A120]|eukprot:GSA120T00026252001.1